MLTVIPENREFVIKDFATKKRLGSLDLLGWSELEYGGYFSPCKRYYVIAGVFQKRWALGLFEVSTGKLLFQVPQIYQLTMAAYFPWAFKNDGCEVALFAADGDLEIWDIPNGKRKRTLAPAPSEWKNGHRRSALSWSPNGKILLSWDECSGGVRVWNLATGKDRVCATILRPGDYDYPPNLAWSAESRMFAIGGLGNGRNRIQVFEAASARLRCEFGNHALDVRALAFSPDGHLLASGSTDSTVLIWDMTAVQKLSERQASRLNARQF